MSYFEARRVGDSVARVRELDRIREFLTSNSVTVVIDLIFTIVFFAVMYAYSPILTLIVVLSIPFYVVISAVISPVLREKLEEKFRRGAENRRSEEHTSELQSLMRISYAVFCLKKTIKHVTYT